MSLILHPDRVSRALYYGTRWRIRRLLRIPDKINQPVVGGDMNAAIERHRRICKTLLAHLPENEKLRGSVVAEIGCGDCLAAADMMLGLGACHVHLIEYNRIEVQQKHRTILEALADDHSIPNRCEIISPDTPPTLNDQKATAHQGLLEEIGISEQVDLVYSFDVVEHVEDLDGFFGCCSKMLRPGGISLHKFDLSGHEYFEDPLPPLDFQTYPTWLFNLMFPKYRRAVGNFADTILDTMKKQGFKILEVVPLRSADPVYLETIWPKLRKEARVRSKDILSLLDVVVVSQKI